MEWLLLRYKPTTLFALKSSYATSTVARTLIVPTPYVIKMAFVNAAFRAGMSESFCSDLVERLAGVEVRVKPGSDSVTTQTIQKVRVIKEDKSKRDPSAAAASHETVVNQPTVAYREVVWISGEWTWAFRTGRDMGTRDDLVRLAPSVNYVGKRGSLVQFTGCEETGSLGAGYTVAVDEIEGPAVSQGSHIAPLDDFGPSATLAALNSFDPDTKMVRDKHRVIRPSIIPCGVVNSGYGFCHYGAERKDHST